MTLDQHIKKIKKALSDHYYKNMTILHQLDNYVKNKVVIDCGANRGELSYHFLVNGANMVHAFEPNPAMFKLLSLLNCDKLISYDKALSNKNGSSVLVIPFDKSVNRDNDGVAQLGEMNPDLIKRFPKQFTDGNYKKEIVDIVRLDDIISDDNIGLIKIDVEGHEMECAEGAKIIIQEQQPALLVEIAWTNNHTTFDYFCNLGYDAYYATNNKLLSIYSYRDDVTDFLFLPRK